LPPAAAATTVATIKCYLCCCCLTTASPSSITAAPTTTATIKRHCLADATMSAHWPPPQSHRPSLPPLSLSIACCYLPPPLPNAIFVTVVSPIPCRCPLPPPLNVLLPSIAVIFGRIERDWHRRSKVSPNSWLVGLMFSLMMMAVNWFCENYSTPSKSVLHLTKQHILSQ
jgi:hypothetical protein